MSGTNDLAPAPDEGTGTTPSRDGAQTQPSDKPAGGKADEGTRPGDLTTETDGGVEG